MLERRRTPSSLPSPLDRPLDTTFGLLRVGLAAAPQHDFKRARISRTLPRVQAATKTTGTVPGNRPSQLLNGAVIALLQLVDIEYRAGASPVRSCWIALATPGKE